MRRTRVWSRLHWSESARLVWWISWFDWSWHSMDQQDQDWTQLAVAPFPKVKCEGGNLTTRAQPNDGTRGVCITDSLQWINHLKLVISNNSRRAALLRWMGQDLPAEIRTPNDGVCVPSVACFHQGRRSDRSWTDSGQCDTSSSSGSLEDPKITPAGTVGMAFTTMAQNSCSLSLSTQALVHYFFSVRGKSDAFLCIKIGTRTA